MLGFTILFLDADIANACSCGETPTVLDAYESAKVVVIARVAHVEKSEKGGYGGVSSTNMIVEKVFKGNVRIGDEMTFAQGGGADCVWTFDERLIGEQFLFYLNLRVKNSNAWIAITCGRSGGLRYATDDLLYLNNLNKVRGKTRISGTIEFEKETDLSVEGRTIRVIGAKKTYEIKTDKNGVYEIYDLPAGKYLIEAEAPRGWKLEHFWFEYSPSVIEYKKETSPNRIPIILKDKRHASLNIHFEIDNAIRGKVYDPSGKPMESVCITAVQIQSKKKGDFGCTDVGGNFDLTELQSGSYILAVNANGKISGYQPFKTVYYPNVLEPEKAKVITIGEGDIIEGLDIYIPKVEETITIEGIFLYSDGKPVVDKNVHFKTEMTKDDIEGDDTAITDANGRFTIKVLKGLKGKLYGRLYTYIGEFENCPKLESIIRQTGRSNAEIKTPSIDIQADNNVYEVKLALPFPSCEKAK